MITSCSECGASLPENGSCRDNFYALLLLESQVPGGPGELPHFYAVSCYALQHPISFNYKEETLRALLKNVGEVLDGRLTISQLLNRTRCVANNAIPITRRPGDPLPNWYSGSWLMNVSDVCAAGVEGYVTAVHHWAKSVHQTLDNIQNKKSHAKARSRKDKKT